MHCGGVSRGRADSHSEEGVGITVSVEDVTKQHVMRLDENWQEWQQPSGKG